MAYQEWLLKKVCANYQITPKEMGLVEDVNRSTAESEDSSEQEKGVKPLLSLIADYFEVEVIGEHGLGVGDYVEFAWEEQSESEDVIDQRFAVRVSAGMATRAEWREAVSMDPGENEGLDEFLVDHEVLPLPQGADLEALGAAAQQEQKSEEAKERFAELNGGDPAAGGGNENSEAPEFEGGEPPKQTPAKVGKVFDRHNPQLLERQADAEEVFDVASRKLVAELEDILQTPLQKTIEMPRRRSVPLASLQVDTDYQRPEDREKVEGMLKKLRAGIALDGEIKANEREDGSLWITDGQHRVKAMMLAGRTHHDVLVAKDPQQLESRRANILTAHA
jgi:hypothetical protein